ncbi:hypothetical protein NVV43_31965, partial [Escherichia marmotae]|nr:hypothetical protein [Escherichia marmotae]
MLFIKGEARPSLSFLIPIVHEVDMALASDEEFRERKRPVQPALATFAMRDVPAGPSPAECVAAAAAPAAKDAPSSPA